MAKRVELETRTFPNQKQAGEFFQAMLYRYEIGSVIPDPDHSDLAAVIIRHPDASLKIGSGISHFTIMKAIQGTQCFSLHRTDGSSTDFSMGSCITGKGPTRFQEVSQALRTVISPDIHARRDELFAKHGASGAIKCAASGELISREQGHMDHRPPMTFQVIVRTFLAAHGLELETIKISESRDNQFSTTLEDPEIAARFRKYHGSVATVDFVAKTINLAQSAKNRIKAVRS